MLSLLQTKNTVEILQTELKHERQARAEADVTISRLELDIKKLRADLHVSYMYVWSMWVYIG